MGDVDWVVVFLLGCCLVLVIDFFGSDFGWGWVEVEVG